MKKLVLISFAVIAALVSCQKDELVNDVQNKEHLVFTANIASDQTRTTLSNDSPAKILWETTDKITIFDAAGDTAVYKLSAGAGTKSGTFVYDSGETLAEGSTYTATYGTAPANYQVYSSAGSVPLYMTTSETSSTDGLVFTAQCGVLRVTLTDASHDIMRVEVSDASGNTYRVTSSSAVDIASATKFYITLPEGTYTSLNIYDDNFHMVSKTGIELAVTAGHVKPAVSSSLTFTDCTTKGFRGTYAMVQLWADGPFWAENNIGADTPEAYGQYFAWGHPTGQTPSGETFSTAFHDSINYSYVDIATLDATHDMATVNWGAGWSVPTAGQLDTLVNYEHTSGTAKSYGKCSVTDVTEGVKGVRITGTTEGYTSNSIFLPAAGYGFQSNLKSAGEKGGYWSSEQKDHRNAYRFFLGQGIRTAAKLYGYSVRAIYTPAPATTGTAKATISGQEVDVAWVQLWADGPKFAEKNVGASANTEIGTTLIFSDATKTGANYEWGSNWKTPTKGEMDLLNTSKVSCTYCQESGVYGFKFTGVQEGYTGNSLFLPAEDGDSDYGTALYWSSTSDGTNAWDLYLYYDGRYSSVWDTDNQSYEYYVRPVLSN